MDHASARSNGGIHVEGPLPLARAFPRWNKRSHFAYVAPLVGSGRG